jgi:hypothetical protein
VFSHYSTYNYIRGDGVRNSNVIGKKFNRWTILEETDERNQAGKVLFLVECECGIKRKLPKFGVTSGRSKSCGCYVTDRVTKQNKTHGASKHPLYPRWKAMNRRCSSPNDSRYEYYGAIGIKVCDEWSKDPYAFYSWYEEQGGDLSLTVDRIDNYDHYSPDNCRLITMQEQMQNRRPRKNKIPDETVKAIRSMSSSGIGPKKVSSVTGVSVPMVNQIKANKCYKNI